MADEVVEGRYIVLQGLFDRAGAALGEPAERCAGEPLGHALTQIELEVEVGKVRNPPGNHQAQQSQGKGRGCNDHNRPGALGIDGSFRQKQAAQFRQSDEGDDAKRRAERLKTTGQPELTPDWVDQPVHRRPRGVGLVFASVVYRAALS